MTGEMSGNQGIFAEWQPRYVQHGVATCRSPLMTSVAPVACR
jgi:hypothetical protein